MARTCNGMCFELVNSNIFSTEKNLTYKEGNYCSVCDVWLFKPNHRCICCESLARTRPKGKSPNKKRMDEEKSYNKLNFNTVYQEKRKMGLDNLKAIPDLKVEINDLLNFFENAPYELKLLTLKQYDGGGFRKGDYLYDTPLNEFIDLLAKLNNDKQKQQYRRIFLRQLDDFARKHKLGLEGMTEEEEKIESKKRLYEGIRRDAAAEARGEKIEYVPFIDIITDDKEDETKTNNVNGY